MSERLEQLINNTKESLSGLNTQDSKQYEQAYMDTVQSSIDQIAQLDLTEEEEERVQVYLMNMVASVSDDPLTNLPFLTKMTHIITDCGLLFESNVNMSRMYLKRCEEVEESKSPVSYRTALEDIKHGDLESAVRYLVKAYEREAYLQALIKLADLELDETVGDFAQQALTELCEGNESAAKIVKALRERR